MLNRANGYEWVQCWKCGHKLFRADSFCPDTGKGIALLEAKCHSCKALNSIVISSNEIKVHPIEVGEEEANNG